MRSKRVIYWIVGIPVVMLVATLGLVFASWRRPEVGLVDGRLRPCASSDNCVCSAATGAAAIDPLRFEGSADDAWARLRTLLSDRQNCTVVTDNDEYLHAEFVTPLLRFVDDVEFHLEPTASVIHIRSESRVGKSDLGANRRRLEELRAAWQAQ
ncbi:MAG: DUF1499 domain-containing protein [Planctomycetaceae bacterium]